MDVKKFQQIRQWVYAQIEQWAEDNFESAESCSQGPQHSLDAAMERDRFIEAKKKEFDDLLKGEGGI